MKLLRCVVSFVLVLVAGASAANEMGFKSVPFGASQADVQRLGQLFCQADKSGLADRRCMFENPGQRTFGGQLADELWLNFIAGRLDSFTGQFHPAAFDQVRNAMQQRYGVGDCVTGAAPSCVWNISSGEAVLMRRGRVLYLDVGSAAGKAERTRRMSQATAKAKRDV